MVCTNRILKTATVAAAALACAASVTALQVRAPIQPKSIATARTTTSLDYVASPVTDTDSETQKLEQLEKLLRMEIPIEVGVTMTSTAAPPKKTFKKKSVLKRRRKANTTDANSRLISSARMKRRASKRKDLDSVYWVRRDGNKQELLTREEEVEAIDKIRALQRVEHIRDEHLHEQTPLTERQWAAACGLESAVELRKVIRQGQEARSVLVQANMGLVTSIAKRLHASLKHAMEAGNGVGTILTLQDFLQEGQIGLIKAAERFDATKGFRFSTYATWWIRQRIQRCISDSSRIIRLPAHGEFLIGVFKSQDEPFVNIFTHFLLCFLLQSTPNS